MVLHVSSPMTDLHLAAEGPGFDGRGIHRHAGVRTSSVYHQEPYTGGRYV